MVEGKHAEGADGSTWASFLHWSVCVRDYAFPDYHQPRQSVRVRLLSILSWPEYDEIESKTTFPLYTGCFADMCCVFYWSVGLLSLPATAECPFCVSRGGGKHAYTITVSANG